MRKVLLSCVLSAVLFSNINSKSYAADKVAELKPICPQTTNITTTGSISIDNFKESKKYTQLREVLSNIENYTNEHNIDKLKNLYAKTYANSDSINREDLFKMIGNTWTNFPNIKFKTEIQSIRVNNNFATVETIDTANGITADELDLTGDKGNLTSISQNLLYFKKYGKQWKVISDKVVYEKTILKYGKAKDIKVDISAPDQVASGQSYTTTVVTEIPEKMIALGSIAREPIVYPEVKSEEVFRQIPSNYGQLERVMKANKTNNNELAVASVGFTELVQDIYQNLQVKVTGVALMMHRINVIPENKYVHTINKVTPKSDKNVITKN